MLKFLPPLPKTILLPIKRWQYLLLLAVVVQVYAWYLALFQVGADTDQGNVYRIIYVHVPVAWCAFFWILFGALYGIMGLLFARKADIFDRNSHTAMELGTLFSFLMLATGSLWGRPTWGVWWDWDPRLTTSLIMFLMCCGYLAIRHFNSDVRARRNVAAVMAILNVVNIPLVYLSVNLWRSLHQPQTFFEKSNNASSDISTVLFINSISMFALSICIYKLRRQALAAEELLAAGRGRE